VFPNPDRFDITRRAGGHLAFAAGAHFCLGAGLARLESAVALDAFAQRVRAARLSQPTVEYKANINLRGPARLDVAFDAVAPG
jgi:cytochrome P450